MQLFQQDVFCPEQAADPRVRNALLRTARHASQPIRPGDLLASAVTTGDRRLIGILLGAIGSECSLIDLISLPELLSSTEASPDGAARMRAEFSAAALESLAEFEAILRDGGEALSEVQLELLAACALPRFSADEQQRWKVLDIPKATMLLRQRVKQAVQQKGLAQETDRQPLRPSDDADEDRGGAAPEIAMAVDLTQRIIDMGGGEGFPLDGDPQYEQLFDSILRVLHRRSGHHALLVGERGVGQATVVMELARRGATGRIPFLAGRRVLMINCRYVAPDESRRRLVEILSSLGRDSNLVVCLDGFGSLLRAERGNSNKPTLFSLLSTVSCRLVGLISPRDFEELVSDDPDMLEFFASVVVPEPDIGAARKLLEHFALGLQHKYGVRIEDEAIERAVVLGANYILNERLPAKAVRILQRVCEDVDFQRSQKGAAARSITADDVIGVVSQMSGVPEQTLRGIAEKCDYEQSLSQLVVGQQDAVRDVATELSLIKAGLTDPDKPASVMLFIGQTGTGKTEMAKALARFYSTSKRLRTYTLGNFAEPHSVSGIIGVPAGYVGHDQGGRLINELNADPYGVFLLDEADKSHPDVLQPFLNLFDEGWVRDQRGVQAFADKSIFILTTNVGQKMIADMARQNKPREEIVTRMKEALSQIRHGKSNRPVFTPEFLARIKRIIVFKPLDRAAMGGICRKLLVEMQAVWRQKRQKELEIADALINYIADEAHQRNEKSQGKEGGRIVRKLIADWVDAPIQRHTTDQPDAYRNASRVVVECDARVRTDAVSGKGVEGNGVESNGVESNGAESNGTKQHAPSPSICVRFVS